MISVPDLDSTRVDFFSSLQLAPEYGCEQVAQHPAGSDIHPGVLVDLAAQELASIRALLAKGLRSFDERGIVDQQGTALTAGDVLGLVETLRRHRAERAEVLALVLREQTVRIVLDQCQIVLRCEVRKYLHLACHPAVVHYAYCARLGRDRLLDERRVDVQRVVARVNEHRLRPEHGKCARR